MVKINNNNLKLFIETILNKNINILEKKDLENITTLSYEGEMNQKDDYRIDFSDINLFPNIESLNISNAFLTEEDIKTISKLNLKQLLLNKCLFDYDDNLELCNSVKLLSLIKCYNEDYSFLHKFNNLENLEIINPYSDRVIDFNYLVNCSKLKKLSLQYCLIDNFSKIENNSNLTDVSLLWTKIPEDYYLTINKLPRLKNIYISEEYNNNKLSSNINIYNDLNHFTVDTDDFSVKK